MIFKSIAVNAAIAASMVHSTWAQHGALVAKPTSDLRTEAQLNTMHNFEVRQTAVTTMEYGSARRVGTKQGDAAIDHKDLSVHHIGVQSGGINFGNEGSFDQGVVGTKVGTGTSKSHSTSVRRVGAKQGDAAIHPKDSVHPFESPKQPDLRRKLQAKPTPSLPPQANANALKFKPTVSPTHHPSFEPSAHPSAQPSFKPSTQPSTQPSPTPPIVINFDSECNNSCVLPNGYSRLNWSNFGAADPKQFYPNGSGYEFGTTSVPNVLYNAGGDPGTISAPAGMTFSVIGLNATGAWRTGLNVLFEGFNGSGSVFHSHVEVLGDPRNGPRYVDLESYGFDDLYALKITGSGGTYAGFVDSGLHVAIDDLIVTIQPAECSGKYLEVNIKTDNHPGETSWNMVNTGTQATVLSSPPYVSRYTLHNHVYCVEDAEYTFTIYDSNGEIRAGGFYQVIYDGAEVGYVSGTFGSPVSYTFGPAGNSLF